MTIRRLLRSAAALVLCAGLARAASAGPGGAVHVGPQRALEVGHCVPAAIADLHLPAPTAIDEIRVIVAEDGPLGGATRVTIDTGEFDRQLEVWGGVSKSLHLTPAMPARELRVSLSPVFAAHSDACVERVELYREGAQVAVVRP